MSEQRGNIDPQTFFKNIWKLFSNFFYAVNTALNNFKNSEFLLRRLETDEAGLISIKVSNQDDDDKLFKLKKNNNWLVELMASHNPTHNLQEVNKP